MKVTPLTVSIMLACFFSPDPEEEIGSNIWNSQGGKEVRDFLQAKGLIDGNYKASERGIAWVEFICATPLPVSKWVLPDRDVAE